MEYLKTINHFKGDQITPELMKAAFYFRPDEEDREYEHYKDEDTSDEIYAKLIAIFEPTDLFIYFTPTNELLWTMVIPDTHFSESLELDMKALMNEISGDAGHYLSLEETPDFHILQFIETY